MRFGVKCLLWLCIFGLVHYNGIWGNLALAAGDDSRPLIQASAYILVEQSTGRILLGENIDKPLPIASTTKILTALLVLENADLSDVVTIKKAFSGIEGSSMYLEEGEKLTVEQLLYGLMIRSGNDAAMALADHVGGSVEQFVQMMNDRARELGCENSNFVNPHGLPADVHYSSAADLARIACKAMENEMFRKLVSTKSVRIPWEGSQWDRVYQTKNRLLTQFEGGNGIKTGYTKAAGQCLVGGAERGGMQLISVVLNGSDYWNQSMDLLEYGFDTYTMTDLISPGQQVAVLPADVGQSSVRICAKGISVPLAQGESMTVALDLPPYLAAPLAIGTVVGEAKVTGEENFSASCELYAIDELPVPTVFDNIRRVLAVWLGAA